MMKAVEKEQSWHVQSERDNLSIKSDHRGAGVAQW